MKTIQKLRLAENDPSLSPGPWRIVRPAEDFPQVWRREDTTLGSRNNWEVCTGIQSESDLRLIAAAPELAEALAALLAATVANYLPGIPELEDAQHEAQTALAKLEGREG